MEITTKIKIDDHALNNLLCDTLEQIVGTSYWVHSARPDYINDAAADIVAGKQIKLIEDDDSGDLVEQKLTRTALVRALAEVAIERLLDNYDWMVGDYIIQRAVFGDEKYA